MEIKNKKILIGIPCGSGFLSAYVVDGLFKLERPCPTSLLIIERQPVDTARNYIIEIASELKCDYVFYMDDDGVLPPDTLVKLLEADKDIVGAPMLTRHARPDGKHKLCVFNSHDLDIGGMTVKKYEPIESFDMSKGHLHKVDAIGGACMLVKINVLETLYKKYGGHPFEFLHEIYDTPKEGRVGRNVSEDMAFSERVGREGFEIYADTRIRPVHLGKPKLIRFEQEGEGLTPLKDSFKGCVTLSENL